MENNFGEKPGDLRFEIYELRSEAFRGFRECMEFGRWVLRDLVPPAGEVARRSRDRRGARGEARLAAPTVHQIGN